MDSLRCHRKSACQTSEDWGTVQARRHTRDDAEGAYWKEKYFSFAGKHICNIKPPIFS